MTGIPVIPCAYAPARRIVLNSWDRFIVPLPFCRGAVVYHEPIAVPPEASREEMEILRRRLQEEIQKATSRSEQLVERKLENREA
jgi:lysophospholipid acyltransferase (LPLAT)-like uncharacterized protein